MPTTKAQDKPSQEKPLQPTNQGQDKAAQNKKTTRSEYRIEREIERECDILFQEIFVDDGRDVKKWVTHSQKNTFVRHLFDKRTERQTENYKHRKSIWYGEKA